MSLFDWVEMGGDIAGGADKGNAFTTFMEKYFPGSYTVTMGDSLNSLILGGQQYHIYGDNIQYTVDLEALLEHFLPSTGVGGGVAAAILGGGGAMNFVYGRNAAAIYGPNTVVQRGPTYTVTGVNPLFSTTNTGVAPPAGAAQSDVDKSVAIAIGVLSAIMIVVGLVTEVCASIYCFVPQEPSTDGDSTSPPPPPPPLSGPADRYKTASKLLSWMLTSRLMGIILVLEQTSTDLRAGVGRTPDIGQKVADAEQAITTLNADLTAFATAASGQAAATLTDAATAITNAAQAVATLAGTTTTRLGNKVNTADLSQLILDQWNVISAGKVRLISSGANQGVEVTATGDNSPIALSSGTSVNLSSGPAQMSLSNFGVNGNITMDIGEFGSITQQAGQVDVGSKVWANFAGLTLQFGPPDLGSILKLSAGQITLSVGGPTGASIQMTPTGVMLKVGENEFILSPNGFTELVGSTTRSLTEEGHVLNAAENSWSLTPAARTKEVATQTDEIDGASEKNTSVNNSSVEATNTEENTLNSLDS